MPSHLRGDVGRKLRPAVHHRQKHPCNGELGIEPFAHELDGVQELSQALERVVLALHGDEDAVGRGEPVHRQRPEGGRAVDEDERRTSRARARARGRRNDSPSSCAESSTAAPASSGREGTRSRLGKRVGWTISSSGAPSRRSYEDVPFARSPRPEVAFACGSRSRTSVLPAGLGEAGGEVHGGRRLADTALLVREREDRAHRAMLFRPEDVSGPCRAGAGSAPGSAPSSAARRNPVGASSILAASSAAALPDGGLVHGRPDEEDRPAARAHQREAPLGCDRRRRQRPRHSRPVCVSPRPARVLLGSSADDGHVLELGRPPAQKVALLPRRLEQVEAQVRTRGGERQPGDPPPEPTSTTGPPSISGRGLNAASRWSRRPRPDRRQPSAPGCPPAPRASGRAARHATGLTTT